MITERDFDVQNIAMAENKYNVKVRGSCLYATVQATNVGSLEGRYLFHIEFVLRFLLFLDTFGLCTGEGRPLVKRPRTQGTKTEEAGKKMGLFGVVGILQLIT